MPREYLNVVRGEVIGEGYSGGFLLALLLLFVYIGYSAVASVIIEGFLLSEVVLLPIMGWKGLD
jgi:hypothetical protein